MYRKGEALFGERTKLDRKECKNMISEMDDEVQNLKRELYVQEQEVKEFERMRK